MKPDKTLFAVIGLAIAAALAAPAAAAAAAAAPRGGKPARMSSSGLAKLKEEEGFSATAFKDGKSPLGVQLYSIGYGHQIVPGDGLSPQSIITPEKGAQLLAADVASRERAIHDAVRPALNQNQFDALAIFAYNIGIAGFKGSEVVKRINAGDFAGAKDVWTKYWLKSEGKIHPVLVARRKREAELFAS